MLYIHRTAGEPARPWVAKITGVDPRYGLRREFVRPSKDYADARIGMNRKIRGVVCAFPLRVGWVCEVSQAGRRGPERFFARVTGEGFDRITQEEALQWAAVQPDPTPPRSR